MSNTDISSNCSPRRKEGEEQVKVTDKDVTTNVKVDAAKSLENASKIPSESSQLMTTTPQKERKQLPKPKEVRINPHDLQGRLSQELHAEERYKLINDAKLRAMNQGTASYEDFRQIWMAAHLRPLEKDDRLKSGTTSKVVWNPVS